MKLAHEQKASTVGLTDEQIAQANQGVTPQGVSEVEAVTYQTALKLARNPEALDEKDWKSALDVLGREKAAYLSHAVGWHLHVGVLLRMAAIPAAKLESGS